MAKEIDVYKEWLDISEPARPLNYYQLLRLEMFDDEPAHARNSYRKMNAHVRKYSSGEYGPRSQELLNELAKAMLCLTDATRKAEYDVSLGRAEPKSAKGRTLEEILVGRKIVDGPALEKARRYAKTVGVEIRDALMQQKLAPAEQIMQAYAESVGLPFVDVNEVLIDETLLPQVPALMARQQSCAPLMIDDGRLLVVSPNQLSPEIEDQLRLRFNLPVRTVLCTPSAIHEVIAKYYSRESAAAELAGGSPKPAAKAKTKGAPAKAGEPAPTPAARAAPATPEEREAALKTRKRNTLMAFNFGAMAAVFLPTILDTVFNAHLVARFGYFYLIPFGVLVGATAAGITWTMGAPKRL
ncbi:MAG TPA: hypothetical protein VMV69_05890 [Pirellulales bacterium]|nr:hypothetical protein [Pirellulales bacterium]